MEMLTQIAKASTYSSSYSSPYSSSYSTSSSSGVEDLFAGALGIGMIIFIIVVVLFALAAAIVTLVGQWKMFKKAGKEGYIALIPVYNVIVEMEMAGLPLYFYFINYGAFLSFIPFIGGLIGMICAYVFLFIKNINLAKSFGKSTGFGVLMVFFPFVAYPMLGFGKAEYIGPQYKK